MKHLVAVCLQAKPFKQNETRRNERAGTLLTQKHSLQLQACQNIRTSKIEGNFRTRATKRWAEPGRVEVKQGRKGESPHPASWSSLGRRGLKTKSDIRRCLRRGQHHRHRPVELTCLRQLRGKAAKGVTSPQLATAAKVQ